MHINVGVLKNKCCWIKINCFHVSFSCSSRWDLSVAAGGVISVVCMWFMFCKTPSSNFFTFFIGHATQYVEQNSVVMLLEQMLLGCIFELSVIISTKEVMFSSWLVSKYVSEFIVPIVNYEKILDFNREITMVINHDHFYGPFSGTTRMSRFQKRTSRLHGARED